MSKEVNKCWLKDKNGTLIAPKTLSSQVISNTGKSLDQTIQENEQQILEKINLEKSSREIEINKVDTRLKKVEKSVGDGGSVDEKISNAIKIESDSRTGAINEIWKEINILSQDYSNDIDSIEESLQEEINRAKNKEDTIEELVVEEFLKIHKKEENIDTRLSNVETFFEVSEGEEIDVEFDTLPKIQAQIKELLESGLNLEKLTMSTEQIKNAVVLNLSDEVIEKSIEIPIPVDEALLLTSTNPIQNRIVTEQINYIIEEIENIKENGIGGETGVTVRLTNQNGTATLVGSYGNAINLMFTFTSTDNDLPTGNANCKITINGVIKVNMSIPQGLTSIDVSPYLNIGSNTVIVTCTDVYGKSRNLLYDVTIVKLTIESTFNASVPYDNDILFKYVPYGSVEKTIHFIVDGNEIGNVVTSLSGKQMTRTISKLSHGAHKLEIYSTAVLNDTNLESPKLVYDIICLDENDTTPIIASVYDIKTIVQGEQVSIPYIIYNPASLSCDIVLTIFTKESGQEIIYSTQEITVDRSQQYWNTRQYPIGDVYFRIKYGDITKTYNLTVTENKLSIKAETNDLELMLSSDGRSNNETAPSQWSYGDVTTTFENMNWSSVGWVSDEYGDTCLRLNGDATATINFKPFSEDIRTYGKTIELEFVIRDVNNRDAIPISCMSGGIGFEVKADTAYIRSEQSEVFCNYKEEERVHLAFVIESKDEYRMLSVYLNGVMSDAIQYPSTDNFQQINPVNITIGSPYCGIDLYKVRSYSTALADHTLTTNYIADINDIVRKTETYEDNDIYDEFGQISFAKARKKNSVMVIIGDLPTYKGDKKTCAINYYDVEDSNLNWSDTGVSIDVQGTSSQFYVRKNWKLKTPNEHYIDVNQLPGKVICIKVDYAEATGTHNTQNAVFVERLYSEKIPPQIENPKVRTTIYGKPILLFHQKSDGADPVFYGKVIAVVKLSLIYGENLGTDNAFEG